MLCVLEKDTEHFYFVRWMHQAGLGPSWLT